MSTFIHGIGSSQNIDSSGEVVDIAGLDISSLEKDGIISYEHENAKVPDKDGKLVEMQIKIPSQVVGKILKAKKIFSEKDCGDEHQLYFWKKINTPYLYIVGVLFDDYTESAKDVAGKFRYDADNKGKNERNVMNFSVEGSKLPNAKEGMIVTKSIARKVTLTGFPCNKVCIAEILPINTKKEDDISSIFKTEFLPEIEIFKFESTYSELLSKNEELMKSWTGPKVSEKKDAVHFQHPEHGTVSIHKHPNGEFHVKHQGALAGMGGVKGTFSSADEAGKHAKNYMTAVSQKKILAPKMHDRSSPQMPPINKAMDAGSALAAPSQLVQGAALSRSDDPFGDFTSNKKPKKEPRASNRTTSMISVSSMGSGISTGMGGMGKSEKSKWLKRAEQEYESWEKKEQFEQFMKKKLPHLSKAEIKAIGQTLALQKSIKLEKALSRISPAYEEETTMHSSVKKTTDIMMAAEKQASKPLVFGDYNEQNSLNTIARPAMNESKRKPSHLRARVESSVAHVKPPASGGKIQDPHIAAERVVSGHPAGKFKAGDRIMSEPTPQKVRKTK